MALNWSKEIKKKKKIYIMDELIQQTGLQDPCVDRLFGNTFFFCWELCGNTKVLIVLLTYYVVVSTWKTTLVLK